MMSVRRMKMGEFPGQFEDCPTGNLMYFSDHEADIAAEREVATLLAFDIDLLAEMVEPGQGYETAEDFRRVIGWLRKRKHRILSDPDWRKQRIGGIKTIAIVCPAIKPKEAKP